MPTEIWKSIRIKEFKGDYSVSESGRVKKLGRFAKSDGHYIPPKFIKTNIKKGKNYVVVWLNKDGLRKRYYVHRLVALSFIPQIDGKPHVNHKDGVKTNNHYSNLEWCTPQENNEHGFRMGLLKKGKNYKPKPYVKKGRPLCAKYVIDLKTGIFWSAKEVAFLLNTKRKAVYKVLSEEKKPNTTQYQYT